MIKPMLAAKTNQEQIQNAMKSDDWVAELKLDGARYVANFTETGIHFTSRRTSVKDGKAVDKTQNLPHLNSRIKGLDGTILDGEMMLSDINIRSNDVMSIMGALPALAIDRQKKSGWLRYYVFDCLKYKGKDLQSLPYSERIEYRHKAIEEWQKHIEDSDFIREVKYCESEDKKKDLLYSAWKNGLEGIVLKNLKSEYEQDSRSANCWIKVKKERTFDVVIMGYDMPERFTLRKTKDETAGKKVFDKQSQEWRWECENRFYQKGWIGAIRYGAYDSGKLVEIGTTSGMDDSEREELSKNQKKYIGQVIELAGQEFMKEGIRHPRFIRFRFDKDSKDCLLSEIKKETREKVRYR